MNEYQVSYRLRGMLHTYLVDADSVSEATEKVMRSIPYPEIMTDFKCERYFREWN